MLDFLLNKNFSFPIWRNSDIFYIVLSFTWVAEMLVSVFEQRKTVQVKFDVEFSSFRLGQIFIVAANKRVSEVREIITDCG